ncbi:hypothetical protein SAMN05421810_103351 [Amycolatopsis arida]|uniref:Uncharacterized protein n=1 Tax=Amycolatopsis arida TaxID=587909 RepID=A0A1I5T196_9PSEU|nr:hypothetical protein [Amycolatopsis arida]TDX96270.1 hypothetical protein CLV69_103407 [Amycolatopsis arida]SFP76748.1 hypothetical protein SAMN05421810_103351 [Amycolatopsis arida]
MDDSRDQRLAALFRDAPGEPPPPTFTADDVAARSRRLAARRRARLAAACAASVFVLAGGMVGVLVNMDRSGDNAAGGASDVVTGPSEATAFGAPEQPEPPPERLPGTAAPDFPDSSPKQGGEGSREGSTFGCDRGDRELAIALADELPVTAPAEPEPGRVCAPGWRSAAFPASEGPRQGQLSVTVVPPGSAIQLAGQPEGTRIAEARTPAGGTVVVLSVPAPDSPAAPFAGELERVAGALAARF